MDQSVVRRPHFDHALDRTVAIVRDGNAEFMRQKCQRPIQPLIKVWSSHLSLIEFGPKTGCVKLPLLIFG
jgi:hypothetical protein